MIHSTIPYSYLDQTNQTFASIEEKTSNIPEDHWISFKGDFSRFSDIKIAKLTQIRPKEIDGNELDLGGRKMILAQYPLASAFYFFYKACLDGCFDSIVDLTNPKDFNINSPLVVYYPSQGNCKKFDCPEGLNQIKVRHKQTRQIFEECLVHTYEVSQNEIRKEIQRIHFKKWVDGDQADLLLTLRLIREMEDFKLPLIHCRAGVGRSGVLGSLLAINKMIQEKKILEDSLETEITEIVLQGRRLRSDSFVQTAVQFKMVIKGARKLLMEGFTSL